MSFLDVVFKRCSYGSLKQDEMSIFIVSIFNVI